MSRKVGIFMIGCSRYHHSPWDIFNSPVIAATMSRGVGTFKFNAHSPSITFHTGSSFCKEHDPEPWGGTLPPLWCMSFPCTKGTGRADAIYSAPTPLQHLRLLQSLRWHRFNCCHCRRRRCFCRHLHRCRCRLCISH